MDRNFKEETVEIKGEVILKGTLTIPNRDKERYPAILIIAGSGPIDRNGNPVKAKMLFNIYRDLAEYLTGLGIIALRYDKRGVGESEGDYLKTGMWDLVDDVGACVGYLKNHPMVDPGKIILLGHSEGCMLATIFNAREQVAGMILLGGAAESMEEATRKQREIAYAELMNSKGLMGFIYRLLKVDKKGEAQNKKLMEKMISSGKDVVKVNFIKLNAKWVREHFQHDVVEDLKKAVCPVLAVTGSKDCQVDPEKLKAVASIVKGESESHLIEDMNHILKVYRGPVSILKMKEQYKAVAGDPLHPVLLSVLSGWLKKFSDTY